MRTRGEGISRLWTGALGRRLGLALVIVGSVVAGAALVIDSRGLAAVRYVALFVMLAGVLMYRSGRRDGPGR
jgi:hypothetical protein